MLLLLCSPPSCAPPSAVAIKGHKHLPSPSLSRATLAELLSATAKPRDILHVHDGGVWKRTVNRTTDHAR